MCNIKEYLPPVPIKSREPLGIFFPAPLPWKPWVAGLGRLGRTCIVPGNALLSPFTEPPPAPQCPTRHLDHPLDTPPAEKG